MVQLRRSLGLRKCCACRGLVRFRLEAKVICSLRQPQPFLLENEQRELRKKEKEEGKEWPRRYFSAVEVDPRFQAIAEKVGVTAETEKTGGYFWVFDQEKTKKADAEDKADAKDKEEAQKVAA